MFSLTSFLSFFFLSFSFSFEVFVKVDPATDVKIVQTEVTALLSLNFSNNFLTITAFVNSIYILPVGEFVLQRKIHAPNVEIRVNTTDKKNMLYFLKTERLCFVQFRKINMWSNVKNNMGTN